MKRNNLITGIEAALIAAISTVLSVFIPTIEWFDISLGIIPLVIFSIRRGLKAGLFSGLLWGLLPILIGRASILTITQGILEYPVANMVVGFAGIYSYKIKNGLHSNNWKNTFYYSFLAIFIAVFSKYLCHFIAGIIFWGAYAQWGLGPIMYSLVVNGGSFIFNLILTIFIISSLEKTATNLFISI